VGIKFAATKLITPHEVKSSSVEIVKCDPLGYNEYSRYIVYDLWKHIQTPYVLIVQSDGFVCNPNLWSDEFLNYDYIGALWPPPQDPISYRDEFGDLYRMGNGGFSLRSTKLCKLATDLNLEWKSYYGFYNEDGFICVHKRKVYEQNGCKFAPHNVAVRFSQETELPEQYNIKSFGFHGKNTYHYRTTVKE
jgi:hypothetical protein